MYLTCLLHPSHLHWSLRSRTSYTMFLWVNCFWSESLACCVSTSHHADWVVRRSEYNIPFLLTPQQADIPEGICAVKHSVANYLVNKEGFTQLYLELTSTGHLSNKTLVQAQNHANHPSGVEELRFDTVDSLLDFITKQWKRRCVTIDIWNEDILESLLRRPFFILVSVDAPVSLRWKRFEERYF